MIPSGTSQAAEFEIVRRPPPAAVLLPLLLKSPNAETVEAILMTPTVTTFTTTMHRHADTAVTPTTIMMTIGDGRRLQGPEMTTTLASVEVDGTTLILGVLMAIRILATTF